MEFITPENPCFYDTLKYIDLPGRSWQLLENFAYYSIVLKRSVIVPAGFITDSYSVPIWLRWLVWPLDDEPRPAVIHDWLYQNLGQLPDGFKYTRKQADEVLREAMKCAGLSSLRQQIRYLGVRMGGRFASSGKWDKG